MEKVSDSAATELESFWQGFLPTQHAEKPCIHRHPKTETSGMSYKDYYAHAHCAAAYLMNHELKAGDTVVIITGNSADYLILDLALQYLGAVNITLPETIATAEAEEVCRRYEARFLFVPDAQTLQRHGQFSSLKGQLAAILVGSEDLDGLDPEKLIAFDRLVAIGKTAWREGAPLLRDRKRAVRPSDLYALIYPSRGAFGEFEELSFLALMENLRDAEGQYQGLKASALVSLLEPSRVLHRSFGSFGAIRSRVPIWLYPIGALDGAFFTKVQPDVIVGNPDHFLALYNRLPQLMGKDPKTAKAVTKALAKAHEVLRKKSEAESQGKSNPFLNALKYSLGNKKLYARVRAAFGGKLALLVCDEGSLDADMRVFFAECGFKIIQPKGFL